MKTFKYFQTKLLLMANLSKPETIDDIIKTIEILNNAIIYMTYDSTFSNHVFQSQFDQFVTSTEKTIQSLEKIKEFL